MLDQLGIIGDIISGVLLVGTVLASAIAAFNVATVKTLRDNNSDLVGRVTILEATEIRQGAEVTQLKTENDVLRTVVSGEVKLTTIETLLTAHHQESVNAWDKANNELAAIRRSVEDKEKR